MICPDPPAGLGLLIAALGWIAAIVVYVIFSVLNDKHEYEKEDSQW